MLFNSFEFMLFFPIVFALYWGLPHRFRWILLLAASYFFYMCWDPAFILLILFDTAVTYTAGRLLTRWEDPKRRKWVLGVSLFLCFAVLFVFKYLEFAWSQFALLVGIVGWHPDPELVKIALPVGISFYTFQTVGYVIDVYRGKVKAEKHFGIYAAFISFFPQLVAGPIERTGNLLPQIRSEKTFDSDGAMYGLRLMIVGFFKKMCIADVLSVYVDRIFNHLGEKTGFAVVLAMIFFTLRIYCDFSGYSDIAIGSAKIMGIDLMKNFKSPYYSSSIREFWSRWHISLSTWFKDYVYIPLGGNRKGKLRTCFNLMITFLVSGIWHGANWTFVLWGALHGAGQVAERLLLPKTDRNRAVRCLRVALTFLFCMFAWVFFRANSVSDAFLSFRLMTEGIGNVKQYISSGLAGMELTHVAIIKVAVTVGILTVYDLFAYRQDMITWLGKRPAGVRIVLTCLMLAVILLTFATTPSEFVYFQF